MYYHNCDSCGISQSHRVVNSPVHVSSWHWGCAHLCTYHFRRRIMHFVRTRLRNLIITKWQQILWIFAATQKTHLMPSTCARTTTAKFMSSEMVRNRCRSVVERCVHNTRRTHGHKQSLQFINSRRLSRPASQERKIHVDVENGVIVLNPR